jgi:hypothetical protein
MVCNQSPPALPPYPHSGEPIVTRNDFALVLSNRSRSARLNGRVSVNANANLVGRNRLKAQIMRSEVCEHLRFCSHGTARSYADEIVSVNTVERRRISVDLRLNPFLIQSSDAFHDPVCFGSSRALCLSEDQRS